MKKEYFYIKSSLLLALSYWVIESSIHYFIFNDVEFEIMPHDINELQMRIVIISLLIFFGILAERHTYKLIKKEKEKQEIYKSMANASQHILNNFLQNMMLFRDITMKSNDIDEKIIKAYDQAISSASDQINKLKNIENPSKENIEDTFLPK